MLNKLSVLVTEAFCGVVTSYKTNPVNVVAFCQLGTPPVIVKIWPAVPVFDHVRLFTAPPEEYSKEFADGAAMGRV